MKKILCVILVLIQILSFTAIADYAELSDTQKEDLYNLGIMTGDGNGNLRLEDNITRAEAIKMICVAGNISTLSDTQEKPFNDVTSDHWAYRYISSAKENGIINGDGNGNFYPERDITNEEIVKMIVCLLGYRELAEAKGGYPAGYTATASGLGITAGLNLKVNSPALRKDTAIMIYNALDVPIMAEGSKDADGNIAYSVMNGKNGKPLLTLRKKK